MHFPTGIFLDCFCIFLGTNLGCLLAKRIPESVKHSMNIVFGIAAMVIGFLSIIRTNSLPAAVAALISGALLGEIMCLDTRIQRFFKKLLSHFQNQQGEDYVNFYLLVTITFCASGTNLFGAFQEGISGDYSILMTKAFMDIFAAAIFAATLGKSMHFILIPQMFILCSCFFAAQFVQPFISASMLDDFIGVGGILTFVLGLNIAQIKQTKVVNLLPCLLLIFPYSYLFTLIF